VVLVHPAVLGPRKQQHVAIEALAALPPSAVLWLCGATAPGGDPGYEAGLRALAARLGVADRVRFLGWRDDLPAVLAAADVALLPSRMESFGLVLAEAMALGKPCAGAAVGGIPEVIEDGVTGVVSAPEPAAFAAALAPLVASAALRGRMGEAGRRRVLESFGAARQAAAVAALLGEALGQRTTATPDRAPRFA
jgi:glycosyltransferase involved in cell wall biosynthesis